MNAATAALAWPRVVKCCWDNNSNSSVELNASATALSRADPVRPIDWRTPAVVQAWANTLAVYSPPWSVWKMTPSTRPPRTAMAMHRAALASAASCRSPMANPTQRRACRSSTAAIMWNRVCQASCGVALRDLDDGEQCDGWWDADLVWSGPCGRGDVGESG